jgi:hypothetical protein
MATATYNNQQVKTFDMTPTWEGILSWYLEVLTSGNKEGKDIAKTELNRMARAADNCNAIVKEWAPVTYQLMNDINQPEGNPMTSTELLQHVNTVFEYERRDNDAKEIESIADVIKALASINYTISLRLTDEG